MPIDASLAPEVLHAAIGVQLQALPSVIAPRPLIAATVASHNARVATVAAELLAMEDHPGSFEPWCRAFAHEPLPR